MANASITDLEKNHREIYEAMKWVFTPDIRFASDADRSTFFESPELLYNILNSIQDGVSVLDPEMRIRFVNASIRHWYPNQNQFVGELCYRAYHNRSEPCEKCPVKKAIETRVPALEVARYSISGLDKGWQEVFAVPIFDRNDEIIGIFEYVRDVTFQYDIENKMKALLLRFENLEKKNEALEQLLSQRKNELAQLEETVLHNVDQFIKPSLDYIKRHTNPGDVEMIEGLLDEIVYPITKRRPSRLEQLTSRELQIATLIKEGHTSKEIAAKMVISQKTVEYHRANIRKKIGLDGEDDQKVNLRSYLLTHL